MKKDSAGVMVLKLGGAEVGKPDFVASFAGVVSTLNRPLVIVHGGGKQIGKLLDKLKIKYEFHQGLRITDEPAVEVVEMVLSGVVNKRIVGRLVASGVKALGLSGRDLGLVRARKLEAEVDLGHVGEPEEVNVGILCKLLELGCVPVVSPVGQDTEGVVFNINADHVARALAVALGAEELVFLSNVPGVFDGEHQLTTLKGETAARLIELGVIEGGMIPKVRSGLEALEGGVQKVLITDLEGLEDYLKGKLTATLISR